MEREREREKHTGCGDNLNSLSQTLHLQYLGLSGTPPVNEVFAPLLSCSRYSFADPQKMSTHNDTVFFFIYKVHGIKQFFFF